MLSLLPPSPSPSRAGVLLLTEWQERWLSQQRMILKGKLQKAVPPPSSACRRPFFTLVSYPYAPPPPLELVTKFILFLVVAANALTMSLPPTCACVVAQGV